MEEIGEDIGEADLDEMIKATQSHNGKGILSNVVYNKYAGQ